MAQRKKLSFSDYEKAIERLLKKKSGMIHHSDLAAYLMIAPSTAMGYMKIYAKKHNITYAEGWLFIEKEGQAAAG